jgi:glutathione S-transferase
VPDLYTKPETAALVVRIALEEIGVPYRAVTVGVDVDEETYRAFNPDGVVPTLVDGDLVLTETVAILEHLADCHLDAGLAPAVGTAARAALYRSLAYTTNELMSAFYRWFKADQYVADQAAIPTLQAGAIADLTAIGTRLEREVPDHGWLLGGGFSIADVFLYGISTWASEIDGLVYGGPRLEAYLARVAERPAVVRAHALDG